MKQFALFVFAVLLCAPAFGQECYTDPVTGRQICPLKKAAAVTGTVVSRVGAAITPSDYALPIQPTQSYQSQSPGCNCNPCTCNLPQATTTKSVVYEQSGYKSWTVIPGRPLKNLISRARAK